MFSYSKRRCLLTWTRLAPTPNSCSPSSTLVPILPHCSGSRAPLSFFGRIGPSPPPDVDSKCLQRIAFPSYLWVMGFQIPQFNNAELSCGRCTYFGCNHDFCEYCTGSVIVTPRISTAKRRTLRMTESDVLSQAGESQIARGVASEANRAKFFACKADIQEALARMTLDINTTFP